MVNNKIWTKNFIMICMNNFFTYLSFYALATAFPLFVKDTLHGSQQEMGLVITIFVMGNILSRPFAGLWVDRFGTKKMTIIGMIIFLIPAVLYLGSYAIPILFLMRFINGSGHGITTTATSAIAANMIPDSRKGEGIGYFSMFMSIAMVVGPALGLSVWGNMGDKGLLSFAIMVAILAFVFALLTRVPKEKNVAVKKMKEKKKLHWKDFFEVKAVPISLAVLMLSFSYSSLTSFIAVFASENHLGNYTSLFFGCFAIMILLPRPIVGKVFDIYGPNYLVYPAIIAFVIGMVLLSQAHVSWTMLLAGAFMGIGHGALVPVYQTIAMNAAPAHRRGIAAATYFMLFDLGYGIGSYLLGVLSSFIGYRPMFFMAGLFVALSAFVYYVLHHQPQKASKKTVEIIQDSNV